MFSLLMGFILFSCFMAMHSLAHTIEDIYEKSEEIEKKKSILESLKQKIKKDQDNRIRIKT